MAKGKIRSWHREEFKAGKYENIPVDVIVLLQAEESEKPTRAEKDALGMILDDFAQGAAE